MGICRFTTVNNSYKTDFQRHQKFNILLGFYSYILYGQTVLETETTKLNPLLSMKNK